MLATTHRVAPGLLTWRAWETLRSAPRVLVGSSEHPQLPHLREAGIGVEVSDPDPRSLTEAARSAQVVWVGSPDGDEALLRALAAMAVAGDAPEIEVLHGSYDLPGARLLDLVQVMDVLRRDCPWDRGQTHASLAPYLIEESYELLDAIEGGDLTGLREELGDVLMQVAFHAVVAGERAPEEGGFTIDDVAAGIVDKLVRRHPHVFADVNVSGAEQVNENWEQIKAAERAARRDDHSIFDGVATGQPALLLAAQLQRRATRAKAPSELSTGLSAGLSSEPGAELGAELFALVARARERGLDPEAELRKVAREYRARVEDWERTSPE
jgi:NTP pyrophosphatase (non-canonical NTP hydrolase)